MLLDIITLSLCLLFFCQGWKKGMMWGVCSLVGSIIGILLSLKYAHVLSHTLLVRQIWQSPFSLIVCFLLLFILFMVVVRMIVYFFEKVLDKVMLGWLNSLLGGLLYVSFFVLIWSTIFWLLQKTNLINAEMNNQSKTFRYIYPIAPFVIEKSSDYVPLFKGMYEDIKEFAEKI
jgi:Colicin V production protein.